MKRIALICLFLLLLCGCGEEQTPVTTTDPTVAVPEVTEPPTFSNLEYQYSMEAGEQVERYGLAGGDYYALAPMGEGVLLFSGETETTLTYVDPSNLYNSTVLSGLFLEPGASELAVTDSDLTYYDPTVHTLVTLDHQLMPVSRVELTEDVPKEFVLSDDGKLIYYHTGTQLRCLDWRTGISRLIKETGGQFGQVEGLYFENTILRCTLTEGEITKTLLVSTETGETLFTTEEPLELTTQGQSFLACWQEWGQPLYLVGQSEGEVQKLLTDWDGSWFHGQDFALTWRTDDLGVDLGWYDLLQSGHRADLRLTGVDTPVGMLTDSETGSLWLLAGEKGTEKFFFYHWNPAQRAADADMQTLAPYYTAQSPDEEGLNRCQETVASMSQEYGLEIRIWQEAGKVVPQGYHVTPEYDVERYDRFLPQLEKAISAYPQEIYGKLSKKSNNRKLTICLVREIYGSNELGSLMLEQGVFFIENGNSYLLLTLNEVIESTYYHELFHAMDSYIIMETNIYDEWGTLNPEGFAYDNSYMTNESRDPGSYLEGENRAFIDLYSMSYPKEDRARIMEYAMGADNQACFTSEIMARKLDTLCKGIRKAFGFKDETQSYPWEQYLPVAITES